MTSFQASRPLIELFGVTKSYDQGEMQVNALCGVDTEGRTGRARRHH